MLGEIHGETNLGSELPEVKLVFAPDMLGLVR